MKEKNIISAILIFLFGLNILAWLAVYELSKPQFLEVTFFDVGQGDAIFIETPQSHQILIDGGPDSAVLEKLGREMPFWDRTIDLVVLTHPQHDHYGGLIEVLKRYEVKNILWTGVLRDNPEYKEWERLIKGEAKIFIAQKGQRVKASEVIFDILFPFENFEGKIVKNINDTSIIIRLVFGENSFLFTGDAYKSAEIKLLENKIDVDSDVLKVGHHGSKTSSAPEFIVEVLPEIAVIFAGEGNPYGHPHPETLETFKKYGINILRTDKNGDIKIISNGVNYEISNF
jgi:competence protein ComEC